MIENPKALADRRKAVHLTQQGLADLAEVKLSLIADVESGRQRLTGPNAERVLKELEKVEAVLEKVKAQFERKVFREIAISTRVEYGVSQEGIAKRAGFQLMEYAKWEAGLVSIGDEAVTRIHDAINALVAEKSKSPVPDKPGTMKLSALLGKRDYLMEVWEREEKKAAVRAISKVDEQLLSEEFESVAAMAAKVSGLEAKNAALKAQIANLKKQNRTRGRKEGK